MSLLDGDTHDVMTESAGLPSTPALVQMSVNADLTRILSNSPPAAIAAARRAEIGRRIAMGAFAASIAMTGVVAAMGMAGDRSPLGAILALLAAAAASGLVAGLLWARTVVKAKQGLDLIHREYGVLVSQDGTFVLPDTDNVHPDLVATREAIRARADYTPESAWQRIGGHDLPD